MKTGSETACKAMTVSGYQRCTDTNTADYPLIKRLLHRTTSGQKHADTLTVLVILSLLYLILYVCLLICCGVMQVKEFSCCSN